MDILGQRRFTCRAVDGNWVLDPKVCTGMRVSPPGVGWSLGWVRKGVGPGASFDGALTAGPAELRGGIISAGLGSPSSHSM